MSLRAMTWALYDLGDVDLDPAARMVLLVLADHAGDHGKNAYPSAQTIANATKLHRVTVLEKLRDLRSAGVIVDGDPAAVQHIPGNRRPRVYDLVMPGAQASPSTTPAMLGKPPTSTDVGKGSESTTPEPRNAQGSPTTTADEPSGVVAGVAQGSPRGSAVTTQTEEPETKKGDARDRATPEPSPNCERHPNGTDQPCAACGDARGRHERWTLDETARRRRVATAELIQDINRGRGPAQAAAATGAASIRDALAGAL